MDNNTTQPQWYDKTWLVIVLCIFFFPVGLYALWKNSSIAKGWKIGVTAFFALVIISQIGKEKTETKTPNNPSTSDSVAQQQATEKVVEQAPPTAVASSVQQDFIKKKSDFFYSSVIHPANSAITTMFKGKTEQLTKDFLKENNNILTDWTGTVVSVMACDENGVISGGDDKTKKILILIVDGGTIKFDDGKDNYSLTLAQAQSNKQKTKGIYPDNSIYDKVIALKEGEKIKFSAKVLRADDHGIYGLAGRDFDNQETAFDVEFTSLEVTP